jgi:hypothetical protein
MTIERRPCTTQASLKIAKKRRTDRQFYFAIPMKGQWTSVLACIVPYYERKETTIALQWSVAVERSALLLRIREVTHTSFIAFLRPWCSYCYSTLQCAMAPFFDFIFNSPFKTNHFIWCYITHVTEKVSYSQGPISNLSPKTDHLDGGSSWLSSICPAHDYLFHTLHRQINDLSSLRYIFFFIILSGG